MYLKIFLLQYTSTNFVIFLVSIPCFVSTEVRVDEGSSPRDLIGPVDGP